MAPLGDASPTMTGDLQSFIVGVWCVVDPMSGAEPNHYYKFKPDGTFEAGDTKNWKAAGKWTVAGDYATLTYDKMNDMPYEDFRAQYKKAEEGGTQMAVARALIFDGVYDSLPRLTSLWADDDKKHLTFSDPKAAPAANTDLGELAKMGKSRLERMGAKKE